jgi:ribosome-associated protein
VNTADTKVVLKWNVRMSPSLPDDVRERFMSMHAGRITKDGVLVISSDASRHRRRNIEACFAQLERLLAAAAAPVKVRRPTRPTRAATERRLAEKARRAERKSERRPPQIE